MQKNTNPFKPIFEHLGGAIFGLFVVALLGWTASLTYQEVASLFPGDYITPILALFLFDGGALSWLAAFTGKAKGTPQRFTALVMTWIDLFGAILMVAGRVFTGGQTLAEIPDWIGPAVVIGLIGITLMNVAAFYYYTLHNPDTIEQIVGQNLEDQLFSEAISQAQMNIQREAQALGAIMAGRVTGNIKYRLRLPMSAEERELWEKDTVEGELVDPAKLPQPTKKGTPGRLAGAMNFFGLSRHRGRGLGQQSPQPTGLTTITPSSETSSSDASNQIEDEPEAVE
jgi:hypothetical protein